MDDLTRINGIGPATAKAFIAAGVSSFAMLAALNPDEEPGKELGVRPAWIAEAASFAAEQDTEGKPLSSDHEPEAHLQDGASLPADGGAGDPQTNTPEGSSGTAREASGTGGGTTAKTPDVGAQPGSPHISDEVPASLDAPPTEEEFRARYPLLSTAVDKLRAEGRTSVDVKVRIAAKRDGFRRAGMAHSKAATDYSLEDFKPDQVEQLLAEPNLTVELI